MNPTIPKAPRSLTNRPEALVSRLHLGAACRWFAGIVSVRHPLRAVLLASLFCTAEAPARSEPAPLRFGIVGLTHDHARGFIPGVTARQDIQLVGIAEPNAELARTYARNYHLSTNLFYGSLEEMLEKARPQAVGIFTSTFEHRRVVETCAARGIHVMMEKPLAVSMEHARAMEAAAKRGGIQVVVNYKTTWYPANHAAFDLVNREKLVGDLRKIVVHDGHQGPKEIGVPAAFLEWLTDPVLNGGGALTDFGCYGAGLITWLMNGQRPTSVDAVTQHIKPQEYPKVEDEATIILSYPQAQGIIQASWNWPFNRKDMEIYGRTGYILAPERDRLRVRTSGSEEKERNASALAAPNNDPVSYLGAVVRGEIRPSELSSLEVNLIVTEILDAARLSAQTGKRVDLPAEIGGKAGKR